MSTSKPVYNWLTQNSKIKKMSGPTTFNWGIPAYQSTTGLKTCPNAAACAVGCYATMGAYRFSNVAKVFEARLKLSQSPNFGLIINAELRRRSVKRLRIHDSGDFYSPEYTNRWLAIIRANPSIEFYAYTKLVSFFKNLAADGLCPANLTLIYSYGGTEDKLINRSTDRHSLVFATAEDATRAGYALANDDDAVALGDNLKIGLVYHGNKSLSNTNWGKVKTA